MCCVRAQVDVHKLVSSVDWPCSGGGSEALVWVGRRLAAGGEHKWLCCSRADIEIVVLENGSLLQCLLPFRLKWVPSLVLASSLCAFLLFGGMVVELGCCGAILPLAGQLRRVKIRMEGDKKTVVSDLGKCGYSFLTEINEQLV